MIVVDSSALLAVVQWEPNRQVIMERLAHAPRIAISAATLAETLIVARRRNYGAAMASSLEQLGLEIAPVTEPFAERVADAYDRWGKGVHPASLNFGDCFAYALAKDLGWPLLFVGNDFDKTDIVPAV